MSHKIRLEFLTPEGCPEKWDQLVAEHSHGSIFHTSGMARTFAATPRHQVFARAMANEAGELLAMLCSVRVATLGGMASRLASRAISYAQPLCHDSEAGRRALAMLLNEHDALLQASTLFAEIRPLLAVDSAAHHVLQATGYEAIDFVNYIVDLRTSPEELWQSLGKSTRRKIDRSRRRDVRIDYDCSPEGVERLYEMLRHSFVRAGVPLIDRGLFHAALRELPADAVEIRIAMHDGQDVAGTIGLVYGDRYYAWYGGTTRPRSIDPFALIVWDEITSSHRRGLAYYDFGGAGNPHEAYGPREFKSHFHGELKRYGRYRKVYSKRRLALAEHGYRSWNGLLAVLGGRKTTSYRAGRSVALNKDATN